VLLATQDERRAVERETELAGCLQLQANLSFLPSTAPQRQQFLRHLKQAKTKPSSLSVSIEKGGSVENAHSRRSCRRKPLFGLII
jgi:hypothetical protein